MNNRELADTFTLIADLSEIKGEIIYKTLAYRKAAESLAALDRDARDYWKEGKLREIPGVGEAIAEKIEELLKTGKLKFLTQLKKEVPPSLTEWLKIPGLGPKKAGLIWKSLKIKTLPQLEKAARAGKLRDLPGMGAKSEAAILAGIESLARRSGRIPLGRAYPLAQEIAAALKKVPGVTAAEPAGSLRRMRSDVGDIDILVAAADSKPVMEAFTRLPGVARILGRGEIKSSVEFGDGVRAQVWVHPPQRFGTALQYATGSKDHNVALRELALKKGLSLSEHALKRVSDGKEILCAEEEAVYRALSLPWIPPELRENRGEVEAAIAGKMPDLIEIKDIVGDFHIHTTGSDGVLSVLEVAKAAVRRGRKVIAITDHSAGLGIAGGLDIARHGRQAEEIRRAQEALGDAITILHGSEVEIRADGTLDYPDEFLAGLDLVVASLHVGLRQPREKVTARALKAIRNPHVDIIAHPTGRLLPEREGADLDMEAVFAAAAQTGVALEINSHPSRLDLDDPHARRAKELGIPIAIDTDAHSEEDLDRLFFGVAIARRAWLKKEDVINTWPVEILLSWLKKRT
ncbi:MAG: DNA polymerase/3'-5' exonuclease PolX [Anaerolineales bacterium]|nr:DNA polymerase/3'-5' exonuclease PolX [Anaerolineales bacterium]